MEAEACATSSDEISDTELYSKYEDDEDYCSTSGFTSKLKLRKEASRAHWNDEIGMAEVVDKKGRMWITTGIVCKSKIFCSIEETLYLAEVGALTLLDDGDTPLSLGNIYEKLAKGKYGCGWEAFEVYRDLKSLGYIVGRHGIPWSTKSLNSSCDFDSLRGKPDSNGVRDTESEEKSLIELFNSMQLNEARPMFDVYLPNSRFRKSSPGNPRYVLCLTRGSPPSNAEIEALERQSNGIPLKFCHVEHGRVSFFSFDRVELPVLP